MTLKERVMKECGHRDIKKELEEARKGEDYKLSIKVLDVCEYLDTCMDLHDIDCSSYEKVFDLIEKNNIDISNMIKPYEYNDFKTTVLSDNVRMTTGIGKRPDRIYDLNNEEDRIEYIKKTRNA